MEACGSWVVLYPEVPLLARQWERLVVNWLGLERTGYVAECSSQSSLNRTLVVLWLLRSDLPGSGLAPKLAGQWSMMGEHGLGVVCHGRSVTLTCIRPLSVALFAGLYLAH